LEKCVAVSRSAKFTDFEIRRRVIFYKIQFEMKKTIGSGKKHSFLQIILNVKAVFEIYLKKNTE
jgi:hypothetical protein